MFQDHDLIKTGSRIRQGRRVVIVPVSKFAKRVYQQSPAQASQVKCSSPIPVQLLCPSHNLLLIPHTSLRRRLLLALEREIRMLHSHGSLRSGYPNPKVGIIQHLYREIDGLRPEVHNKSFTFEVSALISVHLDARSAAIDLLGDNTTLGEDVADFVEFSIQRNRSHIDRGIDALFLRLLLPIALRDFISS